MAGVAGGNEKPQGGSDTWNLVASERPRPHDRAVRENGRTVKIGLLGVNARRVLWQLFSLVDSHQNGLIPRDSRAAT
jgi:hypothetical protein